MHIVEDSERAEAYKTLADLFFKPVSGESLEAIKEDFELDSRETAEDILADFNFILAYPGGKVPPLESLFSVAGAGAADEVRGFYLEAGLAIDEDFQLMPDHVSLEFLFMSYLIESKRPELQKRFLKGHIMNWVPYLCEEIRKEARTVFYREIAEITKDFLGREYEESE
jgi:putative dimethyl sulfoxide reductase chaperone